MRFKMIERVLVILLLVVWVLMTIRAHVLNPSAFYEMEPIILLGSLAVLIVVALSLATKRPLLGERKAKDTAGVGPANK